jgi:hypothetical protein
MLNTRFPLAARVGTVLVVLAIVAGCASSSPRTPAISQFEDIPMPKGMEFQPGKSIISESPIAKFGRLVYRGRIEPQSLGNALRNTLEANDWKHVNTTSTANRGTEQVYEKNRNNLRVHIYEGLWYTYVELEALRVLAPAGASTPPSALSTPK